MKKLLILILSLLFCFDLKATETPGSSALKDLVSGQNKETISYESILNKKFKTIEEVYQAYDLYFYEQEKLILKKLFENEGVKSEHLKKACDFWHNFQKPLKISLMKSLQKFELSKFDLVNSKFSEIILNTIENFGFKNKNIEFLINSQPYQGSYRGVVYGDFVALCFPDVAIKKFTESEDVFRYLINHEFEHIRNKETETIAFLGLLGFMSGKDFTIDKNDLGGSHCKIVELRAYVLAAIKISPFAALQYVNSLDNEVDRIHPDKATLRKYLMELQKVMQGSGLVKPLPNFGLCLKSLFFHYEV